MVNPQGEPLPEHGSSFPLVMDPEMRTICKLLMKISRAPISLLLLGETGSGKEVMADWTHRASHLAQQPFLKINCAGLSDTLVESELFGHERGAFTGAVRRHSGLFERAHGGTLFLDEVAELSPRIQAKLLRVLETGEFQRLGGTASRRVQVRLIAATHRDLPRLIECGEFRGDLYFRLNGATIEIPPLRRRRSEIVPLASLFLQRMAANMGCGPLELARASQEALLDYTWPGNVRELRNAIECAVAMCQGSVVSPDELRLGRPLHATTTGADRSVPRMEEAAERPSEGSKPVGIWSELQSFECRRILSAMRATEGNQTDAARLLGISRRTLTNKLNQYGLRRARRPLSLNEKLSFES